MTVRAWRLVAPRWLDTAFTGEGARIAGGRWNGKRSPVVYLGGSLALAALELLVHIDHERALDLHHAVPVDFDASLVLAVDPADLPEGYPAPATLRATQLLGDAWIREEATCSFGFRVPSSPRVELPLQPAPFGSGPGAGGRARAVPIRLEAAAGVTGGGRRRDIA